MPVPTFSIPSCGPRRLLYRCLAISLFLLLPVAQALTTKGSDAPIRVDLERLGFFPASPQLLLEGSCLYTLHFVDDKHLLVTFTVHRLLSRMPNEPEDDRDRNVDAFLLELPNGRILAQTSWRFHDHGQYLWDLGHGHFLLRVRNKLTTIAPLANLASGQPFTERPFLNVADRRIAAILLSPTANLMIVETLPHARPKPSPFGPGTTQEISLSEPTSVQINFYRVSIPDNARDETRVSAAGAVRANATGNIASTAAGYLAIVDQGQQHWAFDFNSYDGKKIELSPFDSTCRPSPFFVSRSEFIAFGCHGGSARQLIGGFNMRGEEMWEQNLYGNYVAPTFVFAPSSGRFALSRVITHTSASYDQPPSPDELSNQTIAVYQINTGKQILRIDASPIERAGQNFTLSPNGLSLALVHDNAIEIYNLPPLTAQDASDIKKAEDSAPAENEVPIQFASAREASSDDETTDETTGPTTTAGNATADNSQPVSTSTPDQASGQTAPAQTSTPAGDAPPEQRRKAPTLYTLPTDPQHTPEDEQPK